nr:uncharacterized protein LOC114924585 [Arachis hypogaea]
MLTLNTLTKDGEVKSNLPTKPPRRSALSVCGSLLFTITALLHPLFLSVQANLTWIELDLRIKLHGCYFSNKLTQLFGECAICSLEDVSTLKPGKIKNTGYAASSGGRDIKRVDASVDRGESRIEASRYQKSSVQYIA